MKKTIVLRIGMLMAALGLVLMVATTMRTAYAATRIVTKLADTNDGVCDADCSLREAIATAASGDAITFTVTGTISLVAPITFNKNLIISGPGAGMLTINSTIGARSLAITGGTVNISGVSLSGGGISNAGSLTLSNCAFLNNQNSSISGGGGIYNSGVLAINGCTFSGNSASSGGAILNVGTASILNSTFTGNSASLGVGPKWGGAINSGTGASLNISNSVFSGNSTSGVNSAGSAVAITAGSATITNSTFSGNSTSGFGTLSSQGSMTVSGVLFSGNSAGSGSVIATLNPATGSVTGNCFENNTVLVAGYFDVDQSSGNVSFDGNWWGIATGPNTGGETFGNSSVFPPVNRTPASFLTSAPTCGAGTGDLCADGRLNCDNGTEYAILYRETDTENKPKLHLYCLTVDGVGSLAGIITQADFKQFPEKPDHNTKVKEFYNEEGCRVPVSFWVLTTGEYQMVIGPNWKGDLIRVIFTGLPPAHVYVKKCNVLASPDQCEE
jgi:CSLREA domain-containing protein